MKPIRRLLCLPFLLCALAAQAQDAAPQPPGDAAPPAAAAEEDKDWRDISAYDFGALADTTRRLELVALAMQVRDFCADRRVPDEFVRERLARFAALSGRAEDCRTLVDY
ncbi:hypothetical protein [Pseudothauera rhizosphaerae]|uniref:UrcA family protein n=1 Tax=Pseudothauera rhizosphaerae TaxID=2565932 RepID=A0A4S4ALQ0_9RHOO|nr:hypothetical protein [Pseudothauera rhizosphaerae]THF60479.1 hypothetical protein E6O51_13460 [Pseudothauera rhizosphaerae]